MLRLPTALSVCLLFLVVPPGFGQRFSTSVPYSSSPAFTAQIPTERGYEWHHYYRRKGSPGLAVLLEDVQLNGGELWLENDRQTLGPYTQEDVSGGGRIMTDFLRGDHFRLTYRGPRFTAPPFRISRVDYLHRPELYKDFGDANACQLNAACEETGEWQDEESATARVRIVVEEGVGWCSGSLINNTAEDGRPLFLTGFHCMDGFTPLYDLWEFDFGYAAPTCANPATEPKIPIKYRGSRQLSGRRESDFLLLEITDGDFSNEDHFFPGWNRADGSVPAPTLHFHHPQGDIRKYGRSDGRGLRILNQQIRWNSEVITPPGHHYRMLYAEGSFQPGSSGSVFYDRDHRIRGQLQGGNFDCPGETEAFVGRLFHSWAGGDTPATRLREWLDPLGTGVFTLDGRQLLSRSRVAGTVTFSGRPVPGVDLIVRTTATDSTRLTTAADGSFTLDLPALTQRVSVASDYAASGDQENGVDIFDIIAIRRHILGLDTLTGPALIAADLNNSGTIRTSDIIAITRLILNTRDIGPRGNWLLLPTTLDPEAVPTDVHLGVTVDVGAGLELVLRKNGDVTGDARLVGD